MEACRLGEPRAVVAASLAATGTAARRAHNHVLGRFGEEVAARYLVASGHRILERNWRCADPDLKGELDIIARHRRLLVVCEVKTRSSPGWGDPADAVTPDKAARLRRLALRWFRDLRERGACQAVRYRPALSGVRVDVIGVVLTPGQATSHAAASPSRELGVRVRHLRGVC